MSQFIQEYYDNSFPWIEDFPKAQKWMDRMQAIRWPKVLDGVAKRLNPAYGSMFRGLDMAYYWSGYQTEWATDLAFASPHALAEIYPALVRGAIATFTSRDVMRFLGKRPDPRYSGEVVSDYADRPEGVCVKHFAFGNSLSGLRQGGLHPADRDHDQPARRAGGRTEPARANRRGKSPGDRCARGLPTCTAGQKSRSSATTVTPMPWLPWTRRHRWARWRPRCAVGSPRTASVTAPCVPGPRRIRNSSKS